MVDGSGGSGSSMDFNSNPLSLSSSAVGGNTTTATAITENVAELQFGPDFEDIHILSNAQVAVILQVSAGVATNRDEELNEIYRKTQQYVNRFNTMNNPEKEHQEVVDELDNLQDALQTFRVEIDDHHEGSHHQQQELELHGCEVASLMNLVGTDTMVEEALALIPSLSRFPEAALDEILDLIRNTMIRVVS